MQRVEGIFRDISLQKQSEKALREKEKDLESIIQNAPFGVHTYQLLDDDQLLFTGSNKAANQILGIENTGFIGKTIEEAFPPLGSTDIPALYRHVAKTGEMISKKHVTYSEDGGISGAFNIHIFQTSPNTIAVFFHEISDGKN